DSSICIGDSVRIGSSPTGTGGIGVLSYAWTPSSGLSSITATNPFAFPSVTTDYAITVTDANNCIDIDVVQVRVNLLPIPNAGPDSSICDGGTVVISATGGGTYNWSPGGATTSSLTVSPASNQDYIVTVNSDSGCVQVDTVFIIVNQKPTAIITQNDVSCFAGNDGSVSATNSSGGTTPYSFGWTTGDTVSTVTNLAIGPYTVTLVDANGCSDMATTTLIEPSDIFIDMGKTDANCGLGDGTVSATATGGIPPYTYSWSGGTLLNDSSITGLTSGTYTVTVGDANGCLANLSENINDAGGPVLVILDTLDVTCNGDNDGTARVSAYSGTAPYNFNWSTGKVSIGVFVDSIAGLFAGGYILTVSDAAGCNSFQSITIDQPNPLVITFNNEDVTCNGLSDGNVGADVTGGTQPYIYSWSNGNGTDSISGLTANTYTVTVTDLNICMEISSVVINEPNVLVLNMGNTPASCNGGSDGSVGVTAVGGNGGYIYSWDNGAAIAIITSLTAGPYEVTVTDSKGCQEIGSTTITEPSAVIPTLTKTNVSCNGGNDGTAFITATGGITPYSYSWSSGDLTARISGLSLGNFTGTVIDANGCKATSVANITEPAATLSMNLGKIDPTCNGGTDGQVGATVSGGTPIYTYQWSSGGTTSSEGGLSVAGNDYTVTVTDSKGCTLTGSISLGEPTEITLTMDSSDATCGNPDGKGIAAASGGGGGYTYAWTNGMTGSVANGVVTGTYTVTAFDVFGCFGIDSVFVVDVAPPLILILDSSDVLCNGGNTGSARASAYGGVPPYFYKWTGGDADSILSNASSGTYVVTASDVNGCEGYATVVINDPAVLSVSFVINDVSCKDGSGGSVKATGLGGVGPYIYSWNTGESIDSITGKTAGAYTLTLTDVNNCVLISTANISEPDTLRANLSKVDASCNGGSDGRAYASAYGGTLPYLYSWNSGAGLDSALNLSAGTYTVTITDANNCVFIGSIAVGEAGSLVLNTGKTDATCNGNADGVARVTATGGTPGYTYAWGGGATIDSITGLVAATYPVTVTDANNCVIIGSVIVSEPNLLGISAVAIAEATCGNSNGSLRVSATGGTPLYSYSWSIADTDSLITGVSSGFYTVTVTDANGCTDFFVRALNDVGAPIIGIFVKTDVTCNGGSDGTAIATASGGTTPYIFAWNTLPIQTDSIATGLPQGTHTIQVTDSVGCRSSVDVIINEPNSITIYPFKTNVSCNNGTDGAARVSASGGTPGYTYTWSTVDVDSTADNLSTNTYSVTVTDANLCEQTTEIIITQPNVLSIAMGFNQVNCNGDNDGTAGATVSGGTAAFTYSWSNNDTSSVADTLAIGVIGVTVTDANGCKDTNQITVTEPSVLDVQVVDSVEVSCDGGSDGTARASAFGGNGGYSYSWNTSPVISNATATGLQSQSYVVTATDSKGCKAIETVLINQPTPLSAVITDTIDVSCTGFSDGSAIVSGYGGTPPYSYAWSNGKQDSVGTGLLIGTSNTVTITDAKNCKLVLTVKIDDQVALTAIAVPFNPSCYGKDDGSINVFTLGGVTPYGYSWSNDSTNEDIIDVVAATYLLTVTDGNGCTTTLSQTLVNPDSVKLDASNIDVSCNSGTDGQATVTITGGAPGYFIFWSTGFSEVKGASGATSTIDTLSVQSYSVVVHDVLQCSTQTTIIVNEPTNLTINMGTDSVTCSGDNDGAARVTASGGTPGYSYSWNTLDTDSFIQNMIAGTYVVTVTDSNDCQLISVLTIEEPGALALILDSMTISCAGGGDGYVTVNASSATPPYTYSWSSGSNVDSIGGLSIGSYTVTVTDKNNCMRFNQVTLTQPSAVVLNIVEDSVDCYSGSSGSATVIPSGGVSGYTYSWSGKVIQTDSVATGLTIGIYNVTVRDANGCKEVGTASIAQPNSISTYLKAVGETCNGSGSDGTIIASANGGVGSISYSWIAGQTTSTITGLSNGTYVVTIRDANGCFKVVSAYVDSALSIEAGPDEDFCTTSDPLGYLDSLSVFPALGIGEWISNDPDVSANLKPDGFIDHRSIPWGTYTVIYRHTLNNTCFDTKRIRILGSQVPTRDTTMCAGDSTVVLPAALPAGGFWNGLNVLEPREGLVDASDLEGEYLYTYFIPGEDCPDSMYVTFVQKESPPEIICNEDENNKFSIIFEWDQVSDATEYEVSFNGKNWFSPNSGALGLSHDTSGLGENTEITMYVRALTTTVCSPTGIDTITCKTAEFTVPNVITPLPITPGVNDQFVINGLLPNTTLVVLNRWGMRVFEDKNYRNNWDGGVLDADVYYYILTHENDQPYHGWIRIFK
ncbi:gliding motility-associated C-terminal domain-containing protein, partial [bacterium AH-315-C07]|nr:gliding motility-associated C-terminal domain-containing protein [bacterium AH-315-C07]